MIYFQCFFRTIHGVLIWVHQNYLDAPELFGRTRIIWVHQDGNEDIVSGGAESCKEIRNFGNDIYDVTHRDIVSQKNEQCMVLLHVATQNICGEFISGEIVSE